MMTRARPPSARRAVGTIVMSVLAPFIYIAAFNYFFATGIPWTFTSWLIAFLASLLAVILAAVLIIALGLGGAIVNPFLGIVLIVASLFLLPVLFIFAFNLLLATAVPITVESYFVVGLVLLGEMVLSGMVTG